MTNNLVTDTAPASTRRRWFGTLGIATFVSVALSACVGIPDAGEVRQGNEISGQIELNTDIVYDPPGPIPGSSLEQIVQDFLGASTGQANDYATARSFLSGDLVSAWQPNERVLIYNTPPTVVAVDEQTVRVDIATVGSVDSAGHLFQFNEQVTFEYSLAQNDEGQWRISSAPDGIVLDSARFSELFSEHPLYFYSTNFEYLVPDLRWFPARYSRATQIVSALIDGPSAFFGEGVLSTAFPQGVDLAIDSVVVTDAVAQVELSSEVLTLPMRQRQLMLAQLNASLSGISVVSRTQILVDRAVVPIDPMGGNAPVKNPQVNSSPLVISQGIFGFSQGEALDPVLNFSSELIGLNPLSAFFAEKLNRAAVRNAEGVWSIRGVDVPRRVSENPVTLDPFIDDYGFLWWREPGEPGVRIFNGNESQEFGLDSMDASEVTAWGMSRDGTRLITLQPREGRFELWMYGVARDTTGVVTAIHEPLLLHSQNGQGVDVVWVNDRDIVFAWRNQTGMARVSSREIGGMVTQLGEPLSVVALSPSNSVGNVRLLNTDGELLQLSSATNTWQLYSTGIDLLAKHG